MASGKRDEIVIDISNWPNCSVPDCPNKCCLSLKSEKCYPHTTGMHFRVWDERGSDENRQ